MRLGRGQIHYGPPQETRINFAVLEGPLRLPLGRLRTRPGRPAQAHSERLCAPERCEDG